MNPMSDPCCDRPQVQTGELWCLGVPRIATSWWWNILWLVGDGWSVFWKKLVEGFWIWFVGKAGESGPHCFWNCKQFQPWSVLLPEPMELEWKGSICWVFVEMIFWGLCHQKVLISATSSSLDGRFSNKVVAFALQFSAATRNSQG